MGKKGQGKNYKDDAPPEFTDSQCPHTRKGLDLSRIKKALQDGTLNACQDCKGGGKEADNTEIENIESPLIWVCLKCGYRGCGRYSDQQHAIKHFEKPHSDPHCLVVSLENWNIWCYLCDGDVQYSSTGRLSQLVTYIQKQILSEPTRKTTNKTVKEHENQIQKLENKNEQQKDSKKGGTGMEEKEKPHKEIPPKNTSLTVKGFSNLGNTCFFNAVMQNQRRQQKHEGKVGLAHATEQNSEEHQNGEESSSQGNVSQPDTENLTELSVCTDSSEPMLQNEKEISDTELCEDTSSAGHDNANEHTEAEKNNTDGQQLDPLENSPEPSNSTTVNFKQFSVLTADENLVQDLSKISLNGNIVCHDDIELDIGNCDGPFDAKEYTVANQDPEVAFCTLADREPPGKQESSTQSCLYQFTQKEKLTGTNRLRCNTCSQRKYKEPKSNLGDKKSVYTEAQKQMLISMAPPVLTLHLKRFQQVGYSACKVNKHVQFPQILDLAPFCTVNCKNVAGDKGALYSLYGIVEHSGTMRSGHYTAYVKVRPNCHLSEHLNGMTPQVSEAESLKGSWFHISDSSVQAVPESKVQNSQAYLLFYERILHQTHGDKH